MKPKTALWAGLAILVLVILYCWPAYFPPKARPVRVQGVNTVRTASMVLTNTNTPAPAAPGDRQ